MKYILIEKVPNDLHRQVKLQAVSEDKTLRQWVLDALQEKLKKSDPSRRWPPQ